MMMPRRMTKRIAVSAGLLMTMFLLIGSTYGRTRSRLMSRPFCIRRETENIEKDAEEGLEVRKEGFCLPLARAGRSPYPIPASP